MTRQSTSQLYLGKAGWNPQLGLTVIKAWWSFKIIIKSLEVNRRMRAPLVVGFNPSYLLTRLLSPQSCFLVYLCCICVCVRERYTFCSCCSVAKSRPTVTPWTTAHQASLSFTIPQSLLKLMSIETVMPSNQLILCHPPLLLHAIFPSIRVFSSESALPIRWPKYWSFSFSISLSNEYSGLTSFRTYICIYKSHIKYVSGTKEVSKMFVGFESICWWIRYTVLCKV